MLRGKCNRQEKKDDTMIKAGNEDLDQGAPSRPQVKRERTVRSGSSIGFQNEVMETAEPFNLQRDRIGGFEVVQH